MQCITCQENKPASEFDKDKRAKSGHTNKCKACRREYLRVYMKNKRATDPKYKLTQQVYDAKEASRLRRLAYAQTEAGKQARNKASNKCRRNNLRKVAARQAVHRAVARGDMPAATTLLCKCGKAATQYHHHISYLKEHELSVIPTCTKCHSKLHRQ